MNKQVKKKDNQKLTRDIIAAAAVRVADEQGIESLSMRRVAEQVNVEAMSLYHHVSNKADLIAAMVEQVVPEIDPPSKVVSWQDAMRKRAHTIKHVLEDHTWAAQLFVSGMNDGPRMMKYTDATVGYLLQAGFPTALADYAWNIIDSYIYGFNMMRLNFPIQPSEYQKVATQYLPFISKTELPHMHAMTVSIIDGSHDGIQDFDFGLDLILEGLENERMKQVVNNKET